MKKSNIFQLAFFLILSFPLLFWGCEEQETFMEPGIIDMNNRITSVDRQIAEPGQIVTFTGTNLHEVFHIMLNTENVPVSFTATRDTLRMLVPEASPLGDAITVNLFFSGKGLAQRALTIVSPPVIQMISPEAARPGTVLTLMGRALHLTTRVFVGAIEVIGFTKVSDQVLRFTMPTGSTGGRIRLHTAAGSISESPSDLILGQVVLVHNFDVASPFYTGWSPNGNVQNPTIVSGPFPNNNFLSLEIADRSTGWGGNMDFYIQNLPVIPAENNNNIILALDLRVSRNMNVNIMVEPQAAAGAPHPVYGRTLPVTTDWQTIRLPFRDMGVGYGGGAPFGEVVRFHLLRGVKIQPPATTANANFGQTVFFDNIRFIIPD
ncbi:MAG TPA: IPT/TIG domain-containing protein [Bacteroidales bacterium]|nr:IPT/TIG domain-containing protein [Bacteroidales bacterium]